MFMVVGDDLAPNPTRNPAFEAARLTVAFFGTYTVDEAAGSYTYTAERATNPAFDGKPRTTKTTWNGDNEFTATVAPVTGPQGTFTPTVVFRRVS